MNKGAQYIHAKEAIKAMEMEMNREIAKADYVFKMHYFHDALTQSELLEVQAVQTKMIVRAYERKLKGFRKIVRDFEAARVRGMLDIIQGGKAA